ncbi:Major facilitator superfamily domain general substrate transporter [Penicillium mononematosum]|uniref:Major facilitator superfamily domain general substrate transporter n=1 Tax=Penicillium mononematosum TaxID=268346 RepID=UPI002547F612|nr:Major facilitator superfamily domain general substrate transporter [Penicillium mononematosum]KAJ6185424.1 Major facilitator superfamily domain general substrate transporter [Penicillium mononematosum]
MTNESSTIPSEPQPAEPVPANPYYGIQENKKLCACDDHQACQWPMEHAVITIPPCAYKCPYCPKFDDLMCKDPQVVKLRAHIKRDHLKRKPQDFLGLTVTPGRVTKPRVS